MTVKENLLQQIAEAEADVTALNIRISALHRQLASLSQKSGMEKWLGYEFESSSGLTQEFVDFAKAYKKAIVSQLPEGYELVSFNRGHFYVSGFIKSPNSDYVYFSIPDVRSFKNEWYNNILIRTAKNDKDFTGGDNCFTSFKDFKTKVEILLER